MIKTGILNPQILSFLARICHTNTLVIADRGAHHLRGNMLGTDLLGASKMLRGHGCFSSVPVLGEAYPWCSSLEESCKIYYYSRALQAVEAQIYRRDLGNLEYRKPTDDYQTW